MGEHLFDDEKALSETVEKLGKKAMHLGLVSSFVVRHSMSSKHFLILTENILEPFTPKRAYLHLIQLLEEAGQ